MVLVSLLATDRLTIPRKVYACASVRVIARSHSKPSMNSTKTMFTRGASGLAFSVRQLGECRVFATQGRFAWLVLALRWPRLAPRRYRHWASRGLEWRPAPRAAQALRHEPVQ